MSKFHIASIWVSIGLLFSLVCLSLTKGTNNSEYVLRLIKAEAEFVEVFREYIKTADKLYERKGK